ncbi:MAG: hypothetical protein Fues2KO_04260 [Fuerstiella sp.]
MSVEGLTDHHAEPSTLQRGLNFAKAAVRHVASGMQAVSEEQKSQRLKICENCDLCDKTRMVCLHSSCGCFLNVKAGWKSEECPLERWPSIETGDA